MTSLLEAYRQGLFPMAIPDGEIHWFSPDPRGILPLEGFHLPRRLARVVCQGRFKIRINCDFDRVIQLCADSKDTWIDDIILESYRALHRSGFAHSVETWQGNRLVGGLYGVSLGGVFFGESMFYRVRDASKVALHALVTRLSSRGYGLLDVQWVTPHLRGFGACEIPRKQYLQLLENNIRLNCRFVEL